MHELSIALHILDIAAQESERRGGAIVRTVYVKLGPLSGIFKEALLSAYELARESSPLSEAKLVIEEVPITVYCSVCEAERPVPSIQRMCCSQCGTPSTNIRGGNEMEMTALEITEMGSRAAETERTARAESNSTTPADERVDPSRK